MGHRTLLSLSWVWLGLLLAAPLLAQERPAPRSAPRPVRTQPPRTETPRAKAPRSPAYPGSQTVIRSSSADPSRTAGRTSRPAAGAGAQAGEPQVVLQPQGPAMPPGFPLPPEQQQRVDQILAFWEQNTSDIKTFQSKFTRQNYDFVFGGQDTPATVDRGLIRYAAPDKGLMRVDEVYKVNPEAKEAKEKYVKQDVQFGEYWVCDGTAVYQFESRTKTLTESQLPEEMRGKSIGDGPLPFLFGAKADTMKSRYWIREIPQETNPLGEYFLEATPKTQADAANFDRILIKLAKQDDRLLPQAMRVFKKQQGYIQYEFNEQAINDARHLVQASGFFDVFVRPKTPRGWTKVVEDWSGNRLDNLPQASRPAPAEGGTRKR